MRLNFGKFQGPIPKVKTAIFDHFPRAGDKRDQRQTRQCQTRQR